MAREMDSNKSKTTATIKFVCSYGGKILPRSSDGELRYVEGITRILSVDRSVSYSELMDRLAEFCGFPATLKCQLPGGDLETLVTIKSDEELTTLMEEYMRMKQPSEPLKIKAVLSDSAKETTSASQSPRQSNTSGSDHSSPYHSPARPSSPIIKYGRYPCYGPAVRVARGGATALCRRQNWQWNHQNGHRIGIN